MACRLRQRASMPCDITAYAHSIISIFTCCVTLAIATRSNGRMCAATRSLLSSPAALRRARSSCTCRRQVSIQFTNHDSSSGAKTHLRQARQGQHHPASGRHIQACRAFFASCCLSCSTSCCAAVRSCMTLTTCLTAKPGSASSATTAAQGSASGRAKPARGA